MTMMNNQQERRVNKHTINYTDSDRAKAMLAELINHYMRTKHADVVEQMKQFIADEFENRPKTD